MAERQIAGIDEKGIAGWMTERVEEVELPLAFERITGGLSNMTFSMSDAAGHRWVLRRPPLHGVQQSAHDMAREHRIMKALRASAVPVPPVVGECDDLDVIGAPFFVMRYVDGIVLRNAHVVTAETNEATRTRACESMVDTLVALHDIAPDDVGLGDLGRHEHYCARQLRRWLGQWEKVHTRDVAEISQIHDRLSADIPAQQDTSIVHGDYRLDNLILRSGGTVAAVVDWELCTLGDPLADLGTLYVYWRDPADDVRSLPNSMGDQHGFLSKRELVARYGQMSGRDLSDLDFYVALAYWRLAIILEGVYSRFSSGAYGDMPDGVDTFDRTVPALARAALDTAERAGR